ncbi:hypothetical protein N656DRAFT_517924 [Canariomyces notabilis]|uniref:Uncharacterized protein n=1 Tax=Canariomyces notabilis TaxID=2074819 RepID=A0AAN6QBN9_9PEZI|nr:hypothetical protein N656DRAFT_517924 [Canariomyces arenarius]
MQIPCHISTSIINSHQPQVRLTTSVDGTYAAGCPTCVADRLSRRLPQWNRSRLFLLDRPFLVAVRTGDAVAGSPVDPELSVPGSWEHGSRLSSIMVNRIRIK